MGFELSFHLPGTITSALQSLLGYAEPVVLIIAEAVGAGIAFQLIVKAVLAILRRITEQAPAWV